MDPFGESGIVKIGVADKFDDPANNPTVDPATYTEEFGLPVMHLTTDAKINAGDYTPAKIVYRGKVWANARAKYRGHSSGSYPKKNFTLDFPQDDKFFDKQVGFGKRGKICLVTPFDDNSYVRWRLAFEAWNQMDPLNIKIRHFSAVVFLNGKYHGVYTVTDKINDGLLNDYGLPEEGGNLYMAVAHDASMGPLLENGKPKVTWYEGWEKKEGLPPEGQPGAFDDLVALLKFIGQSDEPTFTAELPKRIELRDHYNWLIHCTLIQAWDTLAKNSLHYHHPTANEGRWRVVLWDFNESFGQQWDTSRSTTPWDPARIISEKNRNFLWKRLWANATFGPEVRKRYGEMVRGPLALEKVTAWLDAFSTEVAGAAHRDERKWGAVQRMYFGKRTDWTSFDGEVVYLRDWLKARWASVLAKY